MTTSRFKASLVGAVIGDCMGAAFEGINVVPFGKVLESATTLEKHRQIQREKGTRPADMYGLSFTDDTAMARSVANSLIEKKAFDPIDMAKRFTDEYFEEPGRGYGGNIVTVFEELKKSEFKEDVYAPARAQFDGSGSYGNGGAMRIAPASLFAFASKKTPAELQDLVSSVTRLTHTNILGINGAILLAFAIDQCLQLESEQKLHADVFLDSLAQLMKPIEEKNRPEPPTKKARHERKLDEHPTPYTAKVERIKEFLQNDVVKTDQVVEELGHDVSALGSVPAAILVFLRAATKGIPELGDRNKFEQTVLYGISLGGDTDTIATMAAAMAGALYGMEEIPEAWQYYCEGVAEAETMAEDLFKITGTKTFTNL